MHHSTRHHGGPRPVLAAAVGHTPHLRRHVDLMRRAVSACRP